MKKMIILVAFVCLLGTIYTATISTQIKQDKLLKRGRIMKVLGLAIYHISQGIVPGYVDPKEFLKIGTLWCGDGNISHSVDELGPFSITDKCCRSHDLCPNYIRSGQVKYGLHNTYIITRSHCDCDRNFYNCLKDSGHLLSIFVGQAYFSVAGPQCFKKVHPIIGCLRMIFGRCIQYKFNKTADPVWQWLDNPVF